MTAKEHWPETNVLPLSHADQCYVSGACVSSSDGVLKSGAEAEGVWLSVTVHSLQLLTALSFYTVCISSSCL